MFLDWLVNVGVNLVSSLPDAWRKKYPHVTEKIDELEQRIKNLEGIINDNRS